MSALNTPTCCRPIYRDHPSRVRKYHAKSCPLHPGEEIVSARRAEVASHATRSHDWRTCRVVGCEECAYTEAHMDDEDDQRRSG